LFFSSFQDLFGIGVTALGPRKKIVHALSELRKGSNHAIEAHGDAHAFGEVGSRRSHGAEMQVEASKIIGDDTSKPTANKLITDYFPGFVPIKKKTSVISKEQRGAEKSQPGYVRKQGVKNYTKKGKFKDIPLWCSIPGTPFRVVMIYHSLVKIQHSFSCQICSVYLITNPFFHSKVDNMALFGVIVTFDVNYRMEL
jgi:DNA cross-link repair 1A protein